MLTAGNALYFGCYDFNEAWFLIEMHVDVSWKWIRWHQFKAPEAGVDECDWQAPYLEQYLNETGTERICELYDRPKENTAPCRFVFFLYKTGAQKLNCQFGEFDLSEIQPVPERLLGVVEFESEDDD